MLNKKIIALLMLLGVMFSLSNANAQTNTYFSGMAGGFGGNIFDDMPDSPDDKICKIGAWSEEDHINGIQVTFCKPSGESYSRNVHGSSKHGYYESLILAKGEYITGLCADTKPYNGTDFVLSQMFIHTSNGGRWKRYDWEDGIFNPDPLSNNSFKSGRCSFALNAAKGHVVSGLRVSSGSKVDALGIYQTPKSFSYTGGAGNNEFMGSLEVGTFNGANDKNAGIVSFDDYYDDFNDDDEIDNERVSELIVYASTKIDAIQVVYKKVDGSVSSSGRRGALGGGTPYSIKLDADESIIEFNGSYNTNGINSLSVKTNKKVSPVYGAVSGKNFSIQVPPNNKVWSFSGQYSSTQLRALGVFLKNTPGFPVIAQSSSSSSSSSTSQCAASGKAGKFYGSVANINIYANGLQAQAMANSAVSYCSPCGITSSTINNTLSFYCATN